MSDKEEKKTRLGLALSGGGYRAAAFHLGVFRKLNNLDILEKIDVISCISGGSIAGAYYAMNKDNFEEFEKSFTTNLQKSCIRRIIFSYRFLLPIFIFAAIVYFLLYDPFGINFPTWLVVSIICVIVVSPVLIQFKIVSFTALKIKAYRKIFFGDKILAELPDHPVLAINSTNLSTGTLWTFSKNKMSDSSYEFPKDGGESIKFNGNDFSIAAAVASSSCVPVPFDPVKIPVSYFKNAEDFKRIKPRLIDGGLYDNQGLHKLTQSNSSYACDVIIVSDGSQPFSNKFFANNTSFILYRGIDVMMRKIKNLQFIRDVYGKSKEIAYFSLDWEYSRCIVEFVAAAKKDQVPEHVLVHHGLTEEVLEKPFAEINEFVRKKINFDSIVENALDEQQIEKISRIGTNLTALTKEKIALLSKHGEILTDLQIKLYCPTLNKTNEHS